MQTLKGIAASPGVAIGEALVISTEGFKIPRQVLMRDVVEDELRRLDKAIAHVASEVEKNRDAITEELGPEIGAIFSAHLQMLQDRHLRGEIETLIREQRFTPEHAVSYSLRKLAKVFQRSDSAYMAERAHDIYDLEKSLLRSLLGRPREELADLESSVVVLASNLTPSETANLDREHVLAFVTEIGGASGHTAIVARGLEIPAVVGTGRFLADVDGGEMVIVDGDQGRVILQPDEETLALYQRKEEQHLVDVAELAAIRELPAQTMDGVSVALMANIEFPLEAPACLDRGADGIGLYRTEFLYLGRPTEPSEKDHYDAYAEVVNAMEDRPVIIRTLDLGADKMGMETVDADQEPNPFLGLRSIRLALSNEPLFKTQLRAILRASALGDVRVMFPLITTLRELREAKRILQEAKDELAAEDIDFDEDIPVGMMVESPAAATLIDMFMDEVDFVSVGTNDLIQYTLAVDRTNPLVAPLYQGTDPAVLRLIHNTIQVSRRHGVEVGLCGTMSGDRLYTMLLLGMGLREFSAPAGVLPEIKQICRRVDISQCEEVAARALKMQDALEIEEYLREEFQKILD